MLTKCRCDSIHTRVRATSGCMVAQNIMQSYSAEHLIFLTGSIQE